MRLDKIYQKMVWVVVFRWLDHEIFRFLFSQVGQNLLSQQKSLILKLNYLVIKSSKHYKLYHFLIDLIETHLLILVSKSETSCTSDDVIDKNGRFWGFSGNFSGPSEPKLTNNPIFVIYSFISFQ